MESGTRFSSSANDDKSREPNGKRFSVDDSVVSSLEPSASTKRSRRSRMTKLPSSIPTCQVLGCKKDLSSSKDYHKRHKVCDVHSKTAAVIVNGIQQRFCQQCSRFHIISEFDEGKRSCRKRLVGHNERRRKPQFDTYMGSSFLSTDESKTSSLSPAILPDGFYDPPYNNPINHSRHLKMEFGRSLPTSRLVKKPSPPKHGLNTSLYVPESSVSSNSGCALSLLSTPHQNYHSTICTLENPAKPNSRHYSSANFTPMSFNPYGVDQEGLPLVPDEMSRIEISPTFDALNGSSYLSPEGSDTVSLHALSLHLRRLEEQKDSGETEYRVFCNSNYTR